MADAAAELKILVADKLAPEGLALLDEAGVAYDVKVGLDEAALTEAVKNYDGLAVRSGAKVTKAVLADPGRLKAIARAGVGVDNIDLPAATAKGVLVVNTAAASTLSTAEHALALMYSLARKIPAADAHVKAGNWKKSLFQGTQLAGKTLGIVGLGRIGQTVAQRAIAMEMNVLGYDPFFKGETALDGKVKVVTDFDEFLAKLDVITFHVPGGSGTRHLLDQRRLMEVAKNDLLVVNDARGEVVDEYALAEALQAGKIGGAAIDVFASEPPSKDHPLFACDNVVLTPHLGASTDEAQTAVSVEACRALVAYLQKGEISGAVNLTGVRLDLPADEAPLADLAARAGRLLTAYFGAGGFKTMTVRASGQRAQKNLETLKRLAAVELLSEAMDEPTNVVNVESLAAERGVELVAVAEAAPPSGLVGDVVGVRVATAEGGESHRVLGTAYADGRPRVLRIDSFEMDLVPSGDIVLIENEDQPGVIGAVGAAFGDAGLNIADMVISRAETADGKRALMVLKVDAQPDASLLAKLRDRPNILRVAHVTLPPL
jgi:D-3-phosphoglycerate dehydrogenase